MCLVPIDSEEKIARYIFDHNKVKWSILRVKHTAFMPKDGQLSVFRIYDLSEDSIWGLGEELGGRRAKPLLARADIKAQAVMEAQLLIPA